MDHNNLDQKMKKMERKGWSLKPYKLWGPNKPCPPRLVVNVYRGCDYSHKYCYISGCARPHDGFRKHLLDRIEEAKRIGLDDILVIVSSSTDPFQPIEKERKDSLFAIDSLLSNGFSVLVMTRNPKAVLEKEYQGVLRNPRLFIDVSIPSMHENDPDSVFYSPTSPLLDETFAAIKDLTCLGKHVRVKIEPIIPTVGRIRGQTREELDEIVRCAKDAGAKGIISKTMRLNKHVPKFMHEALIGYYQTNGIKESYGNTVNLILRPELRRQLLQPLSDACREHDLPFCACVDASVIPEKTVSCSLGGK
jgi:DNA repair photolyase